MGGGTSRSETDGALLLPDATVYTHRYGHGPRLRPGMRLTGKYLDPTRAEKSAAERSEVTESVPLTVGFLRQPRWNDYQST